MASPSFDKTIAHTMDYPFDRQKYARYLPVYWIEIINFPITHPTVQDQFNQGNFVVHRQGMYGFVGVACDMAIEQNVNKDSKSRVGMKSFTMKDAVNRRTAVHHERA